MKSKVADGSDPRARTFIDASEFFLLVGGSYMGLRIDGGMEKNQSAMFIDSTV